MNNEVILSQLGRNFIGYEINEDYYKIIQDRLNKTEFQEEFKNE